MIITSEYVYDNIKLNETRDILQKTMEEYDKAQLSLLKWMLL